MMKLYDREGCGNCYKVRLLLSFLDLPYERVPVAMKAGKNQVDNDYLRLNPRGQIPTLQDGEVTLWGSTNFTGAYIFKVRFAEDVLSYEVFYQKLTKMGISLVGVR